MWEVSMGGWHRNIAGKLTLCSFLTGRDKVILSFLTGRDKGILEIN
jgi:hypothetical protein